VKAGEGKRNKIKGLGVESSKQSFWLSFEGELSGT